jgi:endonuclease/exonuclease/phosphatase (EEP) superfamily protein YafD
MNEPTPTSFSSSIFGSIANLLGRAIQHIAITIACLLCVQVVFLALSSFDPWLELAVHFALHGLIASLVVIPILWLTKHKTTAVVCVLAAAYFGFLTQPWIFFFVEPQIQRTDVYRVLAWNILATNEDTHEIESVIRDVDPDILILIEVRPNLLENLPFVEKTFPASQVITHWGGMGIAVFSKLTDTEFSVERFEIQIMPSIVAHLKSKDGSRKMDLVAMHTFSPTPPARAMVRDRQLAAFREWSTRQSDPICLAGDLNTTPWTNSFIDLEKAGFRDSRRGVGNLASWPSFLGDLGIPIDHVFTHGECSVANRRLLTGVNGSDHRPVLFDLSF